MKNQNLSELPSGSRPTTSFTFSRVCDHQFGYKSISHGGITHPSGPQVCLLCGKTLEELLRAVTRIEYLTIHDQMKDKETRNETRRQVLAEVADLLDEFNQMDPNICQFHVHIPNGVEFVGRLKALENKGN